jgi:lysozyme family protein
MADFKQAIPLILLHEGEEYTNDPADPGGPTKWGVTIPDLPRGATAADIEALTRDQAKAIYLAKYWNHLRGDEIPQQQVADIYFDIAVAQGLEGSTDIMRRALGLRPRDNQWGKLDDETLNAIKSKGLSGMMQLAFDFLGACDAVRIERVHASPSLVKFLPGWLRRNNHNRAHAFGLYMPW